MRSLRSVAGGVHGVGRPSSRCHGLGKIVSVGVGGNLLRLGEGLCGDRRLGADCRDRRKCLVGMVMVVMIVLAMMTMVVMIVGVMIVTMGMMMIVVVMSFVAMSFVVMAFVVMCFVAVIVMIVAFVLAVMLCGVQVLALVRSAFGQ